MSYDVYLTWGWACAWSAEVPDDKVAEVARLFRRYGRAGLLYWHSCQENGMRSGRDFDSPTPPAATGADGEHGGEE